MPYTFASLSTFSTIPQNASRALTSRVSHSFLVVQAWSCTTERLSTWQLHPINHRRLLRWQAISDIANMKGPGLTCSCNWHMMNRCDWFWVRTVPLQMAVSWCANAPSLTAATGYTMFKLPARWEAWHVRRPKILWWNWLAFRQCRDLTRAKLLRWFVACQSHSPVRTPRLIDLRHSNCVLFAKPVVLGWRYQVTCFSKPALRWAGDSKGSVGTTDGHRICGEKDVGAFGHLGVPWIAIFSAEKSISFHASLGFSTLAHLKKEIAWTRVIHGE